MNDQNPSQTTIWIFITAVLFQALIWLSWLYRFYSQPPSYVATITVGSISLAVGTGIIEMFLAFGLRKAFAKTPAFWFGIGYSVSVFLSATSMVLIVIVWRQQLFKPLPDPNDLLRNPEHTQLWILIAMAGLGSTIAAVGLAAANLVSATLVVAAVGATLVQFACAIWMIGRKGAIIRLGLGIVCGVMWILIIVLANVEGSTSLPTVIPLCLCGIQQAAVLGQALVFDFETFQNLVNNTHSAVKLWPPTLRMDSVRDPRGSIGWASRNSTASQSATAEPSTLRMDSVRDPWGSTGRASMRNSTASQSTTAEPSTLSVIDQFPAPLANHTGGPLQLSIPSDSIIECAVYNDGRARIKARCDLPSLDALEQFAARLPWHSGQKGTYLLADFLHYLDKPCLNSPSRSALISATQHLRLALNMQLNTEIEIERHRIGVVMDDQYRYHVWRTLARLRHSYATICVDEKGWIVPSGDLVEATIEDFEVQPGEVLIYFNVGSKIVGLQIPWHHFSVIGTYGVSLPE